MLKLWLLNGHETYINLRKQTLQAQYGHIHWGFILALICRRSIAASDTNLCFSSF